MKVWHKVILLTAMVAGCGGSEPVKKAPEPLRVAAASDLRTVLPILIDRFRVNHPHAVEPTFGASGQLAQQIRQGAPFDLFLAANQKFVAELADADLIRKDSVRNYARGTLVLVVHENSVDAVRTLDDLAKPEITHIALANPALAPYGAAGKQVLERSGIWKPVSTKIAQSETVLQALQFVKTGNAEAGLVGKSIADVPGVRMVAIDESLYDPILQGLGVVSASQRVDHAQAFARFILSVEGQSILHDAGFGTPTEKKQP